MEEKKETGKHTIHHEHPHHEHHDMKIDNNPDKINFSKVKTNPWMIVSAVLAVAVVVLLVLMFVKLGTVSGKVAGDNVVKFAQAQGLQATVQKVSDMGAFYEVNLTMNGQDFPVYVTKDGKKMATGLIPLAASDNTGANTNTNTPTTPKEVTKSDKPVVELFVMTHCPYGTQAEKGIIPAYKALGTKADTKIRFVHYFMHGDKEEKETYNQVCIREEQSAKYLAYLECFLEDSDSPRCVKKIGIDSAKLNACLANDNKKAKEYYEVDKKLSNDYGVQGSPTLIINGGEGSGGRDSASYLQSICSAFNSAPTAECAKQLSSAQPSPGFGTAAAASGSAASNVQCAPQ